MTRNDELAAMEKFLSRNGATQCPEATLSDLQKASMEFHQTARSMERMGEPQLSSERRAERQAESAGAMRAAGRSAIGFDSDGFAV